MKNRYIGRTFIMPSQGSRQSSVRRKLNPIRLEFEGKDVLLVDDSIVRGKHLAPHRADGPRRGRAQGLHGDHQPRRWSRRAPTASTWATKTEFVATDRTVEEIADAIGVDHLMYLDRERMNAAARTGNPSIETFCNACFNGEYPTGDVTREMLTAIEGERCQSRKQIAFWG